MQRTLRKFPEPLREEVRQELVPLSREIRDAIEVAAPKDKGDMARAAHYEVSSDGLSTKIGYNEEGSFAPKWRSGGYVAIFKEFDTPHDPAEPFIGPVWRAYLPRTIVRVEAAFKRMVMRAVNSGL